jgi:hypothetical protein
MDSNKKSVSLRFNQNEENVEKIIRLKTRKNPSISRKHIESHINKQKSNYTGNDEDSNIINKLYERKESAINIVKAQKKRKSCFVKVYQNQIPRHKSNLTINDNKEVESVYYRPISSKEKMMDSSNISISLNNDK